MKIIDSEKNYHDEVLEKLNQLFEDELEFIYQDLL
jgi:hypothetical protein